MPLSLRTTMLASTALAAQALLAAAQSGPLPSYILEYAPYSYLAATESYWPSDVATHVQHVYPALNNTALGTAVTLANLSAYNTYGANLYLTSKDDVDNADQPQEPWLLSAYGKPDATGLSAAPTTIIAVPKPGGIVDAFYFMFYSYNLGNTFLNIRFGDHVGDWEHQMVRFVNGTPTGVYISAHDAGSAYTWAALPKAANGTRPVTYIAVGDHANYGTAGRQPYPVPLIGPIADTTSAGFLWDTTLNFRGYWFDNATQTFAAAGGAGVGGQEQQGETPSWLDFVGQWGDDTPPTDILKNEQYCVFTECHYTAGPTGPIAKNLGRTALCQKEASCTVQGSTNGVVLPADFEDRVGAVGDSLREAESRGLLDNVTVHAH